MHVFQSDSPKVFLISRRKTSFFFILTNRYNVYFVSAVSSKKNNLTSYAIAAGCSIYLKNNK